MIVSVCLFVQRMTQKLMTDWDEIFSICSSWAILELGLIKFSALIPVGMGPQRIKIFD